MQIAWHFGVILLVSIHFGFSAEITNIKLTAYGGRNSTTFLADGSLRLECIFQPPAKPGDDVVVIFTHQDTKDGQKEKFFEYHYNGGKRLLLKDRVHTYRGDLMKEFFPTIEISPLKPSDEMIYTCSAGPSGKAMLSDPLAIVVNAHPQKPRFNVYEPVYKEGKEAHLMCEANVGKPNGELIMLMKGKQDSDYVEIKPPTSVHEKTLDDRTVEMKRAFTTTVSAEDDGTKLLCKACNEAAGSVKCREAVTTIYVEYPVKTISIRPDRGSHTPGDVITCAANGNPEPDIQWEKFSGFQSLPSDGNKLTIPANAVSEVLLYKCTAIYISRKEKYVAINVKAEEQCTPNLISQNLTTIIVGVTCRFGPDLIPNTTLEYRHQNEGKWQTLRTLVNRGVNTTTEVAMGVPGNAQVVSIRVWSPYPEGRGEISSIIKVKGNDPKSKRALWDWPWFISGIPLGIIAGHAAGIIFQIKIAFDILKHKRKFFLVDFCEGRKMAALLLGGATVLCIGHVTVVAYLTPDSGLSFGIGIITGFCVINLLGKGSVVKIPVHDISRLREQHIKRVEEQLDGMPQLNDLARLNAPARHAYDSIVNDMDRFRAGIALINQVVGMYQIPIKFHLEALAEFSARGGGVLEFNKQYYRNARGDFNFEKYETMCKNDKQKFAAIKQLLDATDEYNFENESATISTRMEAILAMIYTQVTSLREKGNAVATYTCDSRYFSAMRDYTVLSSRGIDVFYLFALLCKHRKRVTKVVGVDEEPGGSSWFEDSDEAFEKISEQVNILIEIDKRDMESRAANNAESVNNRINENSSLLTPPCGEEVAMQDLVNGRTNRQTELPAV